MRPELGQHEEAEATLEESLQVRSHFPDGYYRAMVHWERMILASMRGDAALTLDHIGYMRRLLTWPNRSRHVPRSVENRV